MVHIGGKFYPSIDSYRINPKQTPELIQENVDNMDELLKSLARD